LAGAQPLLAVENLEAQIAIALIDPGAGQPQPRVGQVFSPHQQRTAAGLDLVANPALLQHLDHLGGIQIVHVAVQRTVLRLLRPEHNGETDGNTGRQPHQQAELAQHWQLRQVIQKAQPHERFARAGSGRVRSGSGGVRSARSIHQSNPRKRNSGLNQIGIFMMSSYAVINLLRTWVMAWKATLDFCEATITSARSIPGTPRSYPVCNSLVVFCSSLTRLTACCNRSSNTGAFTSCATGATAGCG